jgi:hypothetical protein
VDDLPVVFDPSSFVLTVFGCVSAGRYGGDPPLADCGVRRLSTRFPLRTWKGIQVYDYISSPMACKR